MASPLMHQICAGSVPSLPTNPWVFVRALCDLYGALRKSRGHRPPGRCPSCTSVLRRASAGKVGAGDPGGSCEATSVRLHVGPPAKSRPRPRESTICRANAQPTDVPVSRLLLGPPSTGRPLLVAYGWPPLSAAYSWPPTAGRRPPIRGRLLLADEYWPTSTGRLLLAVYYSSPPLGCVRLAADYWPPATNRRRLAAFTTTHRLLLAAY